MRIGAVTLRRAVVSRAQFAIVIFLAMLSCGVVALAWPAAAEEAQAAGPPIVLPLFISSNKDACYESDSLSAIVKLAKLEQDRINRTGGISGHPLQVRIVDDGRSDATAISELREAVNSPDTLAVLGMANSNRAQRTFKELGQSLRDSGIPFVSSISVNSIFADFPNVYTMQSSQDAERLPVMIEFIRQMGFTRTAFIGLTDMLFSTSLADGLNKALPAGLVASHSLPQGQDAIDPATVARIVADLKDKQADMVALVLGPRRTVPLMKAMMAANVTPALFITGNIGSLPQDVTDAYPNALYQLATDRLPELYSDRLRRLVDSGSPADWVFQGQKNATAKAWAEGKCQERPAVAAPDPLTEANVRAIGFGTQYADMIALIAAAARTARHGTDVPTLRKTVLNQLQTTYATGKGAFRGRFENWSFEVGSRSASRTPFVVILPHGLHRTQLAPIQFVRLKDNALRKIETLYLDVDLIRAERIQETDKTFFAEFYLSMRNTDTASIDQIEFTNARIDPQTNGRAIKVEQIHGGGRSDAYPETMKIFKVTGVFTFAPELVSYPFDTQRFSIDIQPKRGDVPFIIQPPPLQLRDQQLMTDGWQPQEQFVSYDEDFIPVLDAYTHAPSAIPFYKSSFVWLLKRETTDYYLRVVVPLGFIVMVAYLSIFIPQSHFEAIVTIQVTALLSAVALYLAIPQLGSDTATISDRIFVFIYLIVSVMIAISILRSNSVVSSRRWLKSTLGLVHIVVIPAACAVMAFYVYRLALIGQ
jgi:ABC-type branched-subunit amino acid transport system substrate-binding protein